MALGLVRISKKKKLLKYRLKKSEKKKWGWVGRLISWNKDQIVVNTNERSRTVLLRFYRNNTDLIKEPFTRKTIQKTGYPVIKLFFRDISSISLVFKNFLKFKDKYPPGNMKL